MITKREECIFTLEEARKACGYYTKLLGLDSWDIIVEVVRQSEIPDVLAQVTWEIKKKMAVLKLLDPIDYSMSKWSQDHEVSLVHELLHIKFDAFDRNLLPNSYEASLSEQIIEDLALAIVTLRRKGGKDIDDLLGLVLERERIHLFNEKSKPINKIISKRGVNLNGSKK